MPSITFDAEERKSITRRQVRIAQENAAFDLSQSSFAEQIAQLLEVDTSNEKFHGTFKSQAAFYQNELEALDGTISDDYTTGQIDPFIAGDLSTSAKTQGVAEATFFPPDYEFNIPQVNNKVNGALNPTGTANRYEENILNSNILNDGLIIYMESMINGLPGSASDTLVSYSPGSGEVEVQSGTGYNVGEFIIIEDGSGSALLQIDGTPVEDTNTMTFTVPVIAVIDANSSLGSGSVSAFSGFNNTERETLISSSFQNVLDGYVNNIKSIVNEWESKLNDQKTALENQNDDRSTQETQILDALNDVDTALAVIDNWQSLSDTGSNGKFVDSNLDSNSSLYQETQDRNSFISTRVSQIFTALGEVTQNENEFSASDETSTYFRRYKWLNFRINRLFGSAVRFFSAQRSSDAVGDLKENNENIQSEYDSYFTTTAITFLDGTDIIHVRDTSSFSVSDQAVVVSEAQPEINREITEILSATQMRISQPIPNTYLIEDVARIFKEL